MTTYADTKATQGIQELKTELSALSLVSPQDVCVDVIPCSIETDASLVSGVLYLYKSSLIFLSNQPGITIRAPLHQIVNVASQPDLYPNSMCIMTVYKSLYFNNLSSPKSAVIAIEALLKSQIKCNNNESDHQTTWICDAMFTINPSLPRPQPLKATSLQMPPPIQLQQQVAKPIPKQEITARVLPKTWKEEVNYVRIFDERSKAIKKKLETNGFSLKIDEEQPQQSVILRRMNVKEVFDLFFSNKPFQRSESSKKFSCFMSFFISEYLNGNSIAISELSPTPPQVFQCSESCATKSKLDQLKDYAEKSTRMISFAHPNKEKSSQLGKTLKCEMNESIYWCTPDEFIIARSIEFIGSSVCKLFDVKVLFIVEEQECDVKMSVTFRINFKTMLQTGKAAIEVEHSKTWNELRNVIFNVAEERRISEKEVSKVLEQEEVERFKLKVASQFDMLDEDDCIDEPLKDNNHSRKHPDQNCRIF